MPFSDYGHEYSSYHGSSHHHHSRTGRSVDNVPGFANQQLEMYGWAENIVSSIAGIDGKACIQRLICELSEVPLREKSFMGYILHTIIE